MSAPDVIVLGSGPGGVSAAWALCEAGRSVLHLEAGETSQASIPEGRYAEFRAQASDQWRLLLGDDLAGLAVPGDASPKYRVPQYARLFAAWSRAQAPRTQGFTAAGMLAVGGMSNAWGGGVARFDERELAACGLPAGEMRLSYDRVERRIVVSGDPSDDLSGYFGASAHLQPATPLVGASRHLMESYARRRAHVNAAGLRLGRSRLAVTTVGGRDRQACGACNFCLYGCARRSIYNAAYDVAALHAHPGYRLEEGFVAERLERTAHGWRVLGRKRDGGEPLARAAARVLLACGALVSARLALGALGRYETPVRLHCHPSGGLAIALPGAAPALSRDGVAIGQVDYVIEGVVEGRAMSEQEASVGSRPAYGSLLPVDALPLSALLPRAPFGRAAARMALRRMTPMLLAANVFLPSELSRCTLTLGADGVLRCEGALVPEAQATFARAVAKLGAGLRLCGAWVLPGSFSAIEPGADLHYAGSIPQGDESLPLRASSDGEVCGLPGVYAVDGAALATLPAKPPALTIMANADRVARRLAAAL